MVVKDKDIIKYRTQKLFFTILRTFQIATFSNLLYDKFFFS